MIRRPWVMASPATPRTSAVVEATWSSPRDRVVITELGADLEWRNYDSDDVRGGPSVAELYGAPPASCAARGLPEPCVNPVAVPGFDARRVTRQRARVALDLRSAGRDASGVEIALAGIHTLRDPRRRAIITSGSRSRPWWRWAAATARSSCAARPRWSSRSGGSVIPFDELVSPTGAAGMRGFPLGRFRDRSGIVGTAGVALARRLVHRRVAVHGRGHRGGTLVRGAAMGRTSSRASARGCASSI